ncbi:MAG: M55 family metallopeptidase, partial [Ktedonobacteraceae bacterium]
QSRRHRNLHPSVACELLKASAARAVSKIKQMQPPEFKLPIALEVTFLVADMAEMAQWVRGVERVGPRTIRLTNDNLLDLYRMFVTVVTLTRTLVDR